MAVLEQPQKKPRRITIKYGNKRHSKTTETTTTSLAYFLTSIADDDILFEIFTRLPNARAVHHCSAVCKRWRSVISHPQYIPTFKVNHQNRSPPFTLLIQVVIEWHGLLAGKRPAFIALFSEDSKSLHGVERPAEKEAKYLDFLPEYTIATASDKDLLLVTPQHEQRRMYVCNPLARQWVPLPFPPLLFEEDYNLEIHRLIDLYALVCDPNNSEHHNNHYTVVVSMKDSLQPLIRAAVFRSETGRWDESVWMFPIGDGIDLLPVGIATVDGAIYTPLRKNIYFDKLAVFDPFDAATGLGFREISLPAGFQHGWKGSLSRSRIGTVRGRLRLWQFYMDGENMENFVFKVWQLNSKYDDWECVHDLSLVREIGSMFMLYSVVVIALHPHDDDVFFFKNGKSPSIWEYRIGTGSCQKIGQIDNMWHDGAVYTVVHQPLPTQLHHSI